MAITAGVVNFVGLLFLAHATYSAYEHSLIPQATRSPPSSSLLSPLLSPKLELPPDIVLETVFSVLVLCVGVVISSQELKPIQWSVWAGRLERSKEAREYKAVGLGGGNPYAVLEERPGFLDIRRQRKDFAKWKKDAK